tara:strand:- start:2282 stop:2635 length:354 start_codon:yes stop_codon:yes gene_type:complete
MTNCEVCNNENSHYIHLYDFFSTNLCINCLIKVKEEVDNTKVLSREMTLRSKKIIFEAFVDKHPEKLVGMIFSEEGLTSNSKDFGSILVESEKAETDLLVFIRSTINKLREEKKELS